MLFSLLLRVAPADLFINNISEEIDLQMGGTWSIPLHDGYQWWFAMGQNGDLLIAPMFEETWYVDMSQVQNLTNNGTLKDHSLRKCSDGTYLHVSGGEIGGPNNIFRYDSNFSLMGQGIYDQGDPAHATNDAPAICGDTFDGFGIAEATGMRDFFLDVDNNAQVSERIEMLNSPRMTGAGLFEWDEKLIVVGEDPSLTLSIFDTDFQEIERHAIPSYSPEIIHYWPSRIQQVGNYFLIALMGRNPTVGFGQDTGDLYLLVLNQEFAVEEWHQLSANPPDNGGMRPWFDIHEDQLVIGYDKITDLFLYTATLNLNAFNNEVEQPDESDECSEEEQGHCADGMDNDGDGYTDCEDQDCWTDTNCPNSETTPDETGCRSNSAVALPLFLIPLSLRRSRKYLPPKDAKKEDKG